MTFDQALQIVRDDDAIQGSIQVMERLGQQVGMVPEEREILKEIVWAGLAYAYLEGSKWQERLQ